MNFVFDRELHTVPDQGHLCSGYYYEKSKFMPNVCNGVADDGILGHGGLFTDIFHSGTPYKAMLPKNCGNERNLLYLIEPWPMFNGVDEKIIVGHPANWHLVLKYVPKNIIELAKFERLTILLHIPEFTTSTKLFVQSMEIAIKQLKIPPSQFKLISGIRHPDMYYWPGFEYSQLVCYNGMDVVKEVNLNKRDKKFTCLNRIDKVHRRHIAHELWQNGLIKDGYFSYSNARFTYDGLVSGNWDSPVESNSLFSSGYWDLQDWKGFCEAGPWKADDLTIEEHNHHWHVETQHYNNAYWNFVTETGIQGHPFLSEKTFKPIANLQPFILLGDMGSLNLLHDLGYKTFGDYIDESYDRESFCDRRIKMATNECLKLARMSHNEHINLIKAIKPILEHNQQHFFKSKHRIEHFVKYINGNNPAYNWLKDCNYD